MWTWGKHLQHIFWTCLWNFGYLAQQLYLSVKRGNPNRLLFDGFIIYFEKTNFYEKAPRHERLLDIGFHWGMVPPTLLGFKGDTDM